MSACTPASNAVDRVLVLLDELERVIVELRREVQAEGGQHGDRHPT